MKIMAGITLAILFLALSFPVSAQDIVEDHYTARFLGASEYYD